MEEPCSRALDHAMSAMPETADRGSVRTIWYCLANLVLPDATRWIEPNFAPILLAADSKHVSPPVDSCVAAVGDLRKFETMFVEEVRDEDADAARLLQQAFKDNDVFTKIGIIVQQFSFSVGDFAGIVGSYISVAWIAANLAPVPGYESYRRMENVARLALGGSPVFQHATPAERRRAAAALLAQTFFIRSALIAAGASGNDTILKRVSDSAHANALRTLGLDLRESRELHDQIFAIAA